MPALCTVFIRGRLRGETDSPIVRGVIEVYRPDPARTCSTDPAPLVWVLGVTFVVGLAPVGSRAALAGDPVRGRGRRRG